MIGLLRSCLHPRCRNGYLTCAADIADLRLSGGFQLEDTDTLLATPCVDLAGATALPFPMVGDAGTAGLNYCFAGFRARRA